jgi:DNA-directed RNA polymerase specialized sigma24 family protein
MPEIDARKLLAHAHELSARYARRLGPEEAADLAAEALARGLERPPADGKMEPWLERIARNLLVDRWRKAEVARRCELDAPEPSASPEELVLAGERRRTVRRSLARLQRDQRRSILHRYFCAGAPDGLSATTARTRLHRGLARLRALTRGLLSLAPPVRLGHWLTLAANPAAVGVFLMAQQTPLPPPAVVAPVLVAQARPVGRKAPVPAPVAAPAPVPAAPRARPQPPPSPPPKQVYVFGDDEVQGEHQNGDGEMIRGGRKVRHSSLIEIPADFVLSVAKSVEDL